MTSQPDADPNRKRKPAIVLVLGDQLSLGLSSLRRADRAQDVVLMVEVMEEATYVRHHKKKIAFILSAMRHFAKTLQSEGWTVDYVRLDDPLNTGSFTGEIGRAVARHRADQVVMTEPGEWRVLDAAQAWPTSFGVTLDLLTDDRFICSVAEFRAWAKGRKQLRMEYFYREMRRKTGLLMTGDEPEGGQWNYDADNRKPAKADLFMPRPYQPDLDDTTRDVLELVGERFANHFGRLEPFRFAVTPEEAAEVLTRFLKVALPRFGDYQDAMLQGEPWLYHAVISPYLNVGLLDPLTVCRAVEDEYRAGRVPLNAAEGFIRQIIGWREYVRGIYWLKMPGYTQVNELGAARPLPAFYWTGETDMACLRAAIGQTRDEAYAHHIQRLMVTGNFAMLAGINPAEVHEWYLAVYADAFEWVEAPNTLGMSQFADGGLLGSKPYAGGGNYINKMSDYCGSCRYDVKQRTGRDACPFNALYWDFLDRNADRLRRNPRLGPVYATWEKMGEVARQETRQSARMFLDTLVGWQEPEKRS
ncbi:cryptochrome/photolyase family protein [Pannonibacter sp.]|uniref:cryptochrome/photolyase family protein n=1 Tax=Pannonibacter sp. TaxID=1906786 RepID=UPI003F707F79